MIPKRFLCSSSTSTLLQRYSSSVPSLRMRWSYWAGWGIRGEAAGVRCRAANNKDGADSATIRPKWVEVLPLAHALPQVQTPTIATSMMAAMYGAVRTWDDSVTLTDLFGYSGHAFILNIERTLCPSGPTAWDWGAILFPLRTGATGLSQPAAA